MMTFIYRKEIDKVIAVILNVENKKKQEYYANYFQSISITKHL